MRAAAFAVVCFLSASGCGYRFVAPGSSLPGGVRSVHVPVFSNATAEPSAEVLLTEALRQHLHRAGRLGGADAESHVAGSLDALSAAPLVASPGRLPNYRLTLAATVVLRRGEVELARVQVTGAEEFPAGADVLWTETYRAQALARLCDDVMRDALDRLSMAQAR